MERKIAVGTIIKALDGIQMSPTQTRDMTSLAAPLIQDTANPRRSSSSRRSSKITASGLTVLISDKITANSKGVDP